MNTHVKDVLEQANTLSEDERIAPTCYTPGRR
jgi:hypothetical protein